MGRKHQRISVTLLSDVVKVNDKSQLKTSVTVSMTSSCSKGEENSGKMSSSDVSRRLASEKSSLTSGCSDCRRIRSKESKEVCLRDLLLQTISRKSRVRVRKNSKKSIICDEPKNESLNTNPSSGQFGDRKLKSTKDVLKVTCQSEADLLNERIRCASEESDESCYGHLTSNSDHSDASDGDVAVELLPVESDPCVDASVTSEQHEMKATHAMHEQNGSKFGESIVVEDASCGKSASSVNCQPKQSLNNKNFTAFLSAVEKEHSKDSKNLLSQKKNLLKKTRSRLDSGPRVDKELDSEEDGRAKRPPPLNNSWKGSTPTSTWSSHELADGRSLRDRQNVQLRWNDLQNALPVTGRRKLSERSNDADASSGGEDSSRSSSVLSDVSVGDFGGVPPSPPLPALSMPVPQSMEFNFEALTEYTVGANFIRYRCLPHECPLCLAKYEQYVNQCVAGGESCHTDDSLTRSLVDQSSLSSSSDDDKQSSSSSSQTMKSYRKRMLRAQHHSSTADETGADCVPAVKPSTTKGGRVEVSVKKLLDEGAKRESSASRLQRRYRTATQAGDCMGSSNVGRFHSSRHDYMESSRSEYCRFYHDFYATMFGYVPHFVPYYIQPIYYCTYPCMPMMTGYMKPYEHVPTTTADSKCPSQSHHSQRPLNKQHFQKSPTKSWSSGSETLESHNSLSTKCPERQWVNLATCEDSSSTDNQLGCFKVMCYNVLCDKYATHKMYGYCPPWALNWEYRKKGIIKEIQTANPDVIALQEVEMEQFYTFFLPQLMDDGYEGIFSPKSRARTMIEADRKHVDGCAIFYRTSKYSLVKEHLIEFNKMALSAASGIGQMALSGAGGGSHHMINRVMTKDNIGLAALLEVKDNLCNGGGAGSTAEKRTLMVATCHMHWDPEYCDVKLIQTMMLMHELKNIIQLSHPDYQPAIDSCEADVPLILCGDLNSLPDSGVVEYLTTGHITANHSDFKDHGYEECLRKLSASSGHNEYTHNFKLSQAYNGDIMPFTNYTHDFKGIIDYIFYSSNHLHPLRVLGQIDPEWLLQNDVIGCPHPSISSDHLPLIVDFQMTNAEQIIVDAV